MRLSFKQAGSFSVQCSVQITLSRKCYISRLKLLISGNAKILANTPAPTEDDAAFKGVKEAKLLLLMMHLHFSDLFYVSTKMPPPSG